MIKYGVIGLVLGYPYHWKVALIAAPIGMVMGLLEWKNRYYLITETKTVISQGIFNVCVKVLPNDSIQTFSMITSPLDWILKMKTIQLNTSTTSEVWSVLSAVTGLSFGGVQLKWVKEAPEVIRFYLYPQDEDGY